jgi:hypothetical protein
VKIELLYFEDCPHWKPTLSLVESVAAELSISAEIVLCNVKNQRDAVAYRFLGSPSLRIDGHDLEELDNLGEEFGVTCRVYKNGDVFSGTPSREAVMQRLREVLDVH